MASRYDGRRHGDSSREKAESQALKEAWDSADQLNAQRPEGAQYRWVPRGTVYVDEDTLPREGGIDPKLVEQYANVWHDLPPIVVQRTTFKLIDGAHRLNAAFETAAGTDHVKIVELDVESDLDLKEQAWELNTKHGRGLTLKERTAFVKFLIDRYPNSSTSELASRANMDRVTVSKMREKPETVTYQRGGQEITRQATSPRKPRENQPERPAPVTNAPVRDSYTESMPTEPMALTGLRAVASIRDVSAWLAANAQFGDEIREYLGAAQRNLTEMADILEGVPV